MALPKISYGILIIGGVFVLIVAYLRYIEKRSLFFPTREIEFSPKEVWLEYEDVFFKTDDGVEINAWFIPAKDARFTILFSHGNAGNISHRIEKLKFFHDLGCNVLIFDYRGYGKSNGSPSEAGFYKDIQAAYGYLLSRNIAAEDIVGYGESIGGAVTIDLASKKKLKALVVDCTFSNAPDMVKVAYPFLPYWVFASRWDSLDKIKSISVPKLMIHSVNDEIVPFKLGRKLFDAAPNPKEFLSIRGGHNSCFFESKDILREKMSEFIKKLQ